jgi:hypothetical protein
MPSIVQFEHVTSPSAVMWYLCITSHLTFLARQAAQAFAALLLTGFGLPLLSSPALVLGLFFDPESVDAGECASLDSSESIVVFSVMTTAGVFLVVAVEPQACDCTSNDDDNINSPIYDGIEVIMRIMKEIK